MLASRRDGRAVELRLDAVINSGDLDQAVRRLRQVVLILRVASIPLDYAQLAADLTSCSSPDRERAAVHRRWRSDYNSVAPMT
jgi:CRISPR type I-E-associated protein CasB/Cse2